MRKVGAEIALFASLTVLWYISWPTDKVVPKISLSPISLYYGAFGGPLTKWVQKLHFSPV